MLMEVEVVEEGSSMAVYCHRCGTQQPLSARFCSGCGATIVGSQPIPGRPLYRPIVGRRIAGVCQALALAYGWDVAVIRIVAVVGLFFSGGFVGVAYVAGWIGIPEEPVGFPGEYPPNL
jgi:phage shock protein PspC (stress-responsive transcriptional regulator)